MRDTVEPSPFPGVSREKHKILLCRHRQQRGKTANGGAWANVDGLAKEQRANPRKRRKICRVQPSCKAHERIIVSDPYLFSCQACFDIVVPRRKTNFKPTRCLDDVVSGTSHSPQHTDTAESACGICMTTGEGNVVTSIPTHTATSCGAFSCLSDSRRSDSTRFVCSFSLAHCCAVDRDGSSDS